jgi:TM2 domain-containing membrane protein YozV
MSSVSYPNPQAMFYQHYEAVRRDEVVGILLALFLGTFGIHHFYLHRTGLGILYCCFCWTGIPTLLGFIECFFMAGRVREYNAMQAAGIALERAWHREYSNGSTGLSRGCASGRGACSGSRFCAGCRLRSRDSSGGGASVLPELPKSESAGCEVLRRMRTGVLKEGPEIQGTRDKTGTGDQGNKKVSQPAGKGPCGPFSICGSATYLRARSACSR